VVVPARRVRYQSGDRLRLVMEVIARHEVAVGAYLARRAGREAAEDLLGDVWVAAFESRRTYDRSRRPAGCESAP
jgi:DNA-directed RNA polymerase specialized sigma24 family protein